MEIDELKAQWQKEAAQYSHSNKKDMEQIQLILKGKTDDLITSMKKKYERIVSMMLGSMLLIILILPLLTDGFTYPGSVNGFAKAMFFYVILILFYWEKLKSINHLMLSDHIKERLEQLLKMLNRNLKIELTFIMVFFIGLIFIGRFFYGHGLNGIIKPDVIIGFALSVLFTALMIYFIRKRYQNQIKELQKYLSEYDSGLL